MTILPPDDDGFEAFFHEHEHKLMGYLITMIGDRALAEDVLNESFLVLWRQWRRPQVRHGQTFAYLTVIARNLMLREIRSRNCRALPTADPIEDSPIVIEPVEETVINGKWLQWALGQLSPREVNNHVAHGE